MVSVASGSCSGSCSGLEVSVGVTFAGVGLSHSPRMSSHDVNTVLRAISMAPHIRVCLMGFILVDGF